MSATEAVAVAFLGMSVLSMAWQGIALLRLVQDSSLRSRATQAYGGLLRTAVCRVSVAIAYVVIGINALWPQIEVLLATLAVFCATQGVWQLNAWADLRLAARLRAASPEPRKVAADDPTTR